MDETGRSNDEIEVRVPNRKLTEKEFEELAIRLNKNRGEWDNGLLKQFFDSDSLKEWGFIEQELNDIFDDTKILKDDEFNLEEELAKIDKPNTIAGDIFLFFFKKL